MRRLCLDHLSLYDITALELIEIAAEVGCDAVSMFITPAPLGPYLDLTTDQKAKSEVLSALRDTGLSVGIVEPFMLEEHTDWNLLERSAALAAELGGTVNALCFDKEIARLEASFGRLAEICGSEGARMAVEGFTLSTVRTLADALAIADTVGPGIGITADVLHILRTGGNWADFAALPQDRIFHVQISDGPLDTPADTFAEATVARLPPGRGEFDLAGFMPLVPSSALLAIEAPFIAPTGMTPLDRAQTIVDAIRSFMVPSLN